jgi:hypothetical protein
MSKRRLTNREQLHKQLKDSEPNSVLHKEFRMVLAGMERPKEKAVPVLVKLLKSLTTQEAKHFVAKVLGSTKDSRVVLPLIRAAAAPENEGYRANYIWPLDSSSYDCTQQMPKLVRLLLSRVSYDEVTWVCIELIRKMKGPFEPAVARKHIRMLLAEVKQPLKPKELVSTHANRLEAADKIMCTYFNQTVKTYWEKWNKGEWNIDED